MPEHLEREIKLRYDSPDAARTAVRALGARPFRARRLQADALLDAEGRTLSARGQVLRIRIEEGRSVVTFKTPAEHPTMKLREELETSVGDGGTLLSLFERLGLRIWFRYEKYREEYALDGVVLAVDETPVGTFLEIEGRDDETITAVARALGRTSDDYVLDSYRSLFVQYCADRGLPATDMVFGAQP